MKKKSKFAKHVTAENKLIDINDPQTVFEEDDSLLFCWNLISRGENRELALKFALEGEAILDKRLKAIIKKPSDNSELMRIFTGYNIISIAYSWNNLFEKNRYNDFLYLHIPNMWPFMKTGLEPYLELLLIKKQVIYLEEIFEDVKFRNFFFPHYEAFISLLVNPEYECTCMQKVIPITKRVENDTHKYF